MTIDGPVASGKTTVAREVATRLGFTLLDTGAIYRSLALVAGRRRVALDDAEALAGLAADLDITFELAAGVNRVRLAGEDVSAEIRRPEISRAASIVSALPEVRAALLDRQRSIAAAGDVVAEGRDTGTVVFPAAEAKFFITASDEVRARRRQREQAGRGQELPFPEVLAALRERDQRDATRSVAPMRPAEDAHVIDTSDLDLEQVVAEVLARIPD
ncbi:MAG: (d)CMP kinase [Thermoanaerobaculia bacterium]|nr:(d)CMP kinase [Thermoanaerobaculia bacterium]